MNPQCQSSVTTTSVRLVSREASVAITSACRPGFSVILRPARVSAWPIQGTPARWALRPGWEEGTSARRATPCPRDGETLRTEMFIGHPNYYLDQINSLDNRLGYRTLLYAELL
jgi:hypothetical protein